MKYSIWHFSFLVAMFFPPNQRVLQAEQSLAHAAVGDPQLRTDHPWFPGELSCSTFERLFETQACLYRRETGREATTEEDKAIASWYWRNINYYHAYCPREAFWGNEITSAEESPRDAVLDYWTGLFSYGFSLCYTTHQQYTAEMEKLLGRGRARSVDVDGHTSFEVYLADAQYGAEGDWALLDQDISTIVFDDSTDPQRLINVADVVYSAVSSGLKPRPLMEREALLDNRAAPEGNRGWFKSGLYFPKDDVSNANESDALGVYTKILGTAPLSGYAATPPMISLKRGETIRRYLQPGLGNKTYVYWGPNYSSVNKCDPVPGPSRDRTWAAQPDRMYRASRDTDLCFARYGNVVHTYQPKFSDGTYRDGVIEENERSVTFYFYSPYAIAATPAATKAKQLWAIHSLGCTNGLIISAKSALKCAIQVSRDNGATWSDELMLINQLDLTDLVKGHHSYHLKFNGPRSQLEQAGITMRTVCMANDRLMPHLKSHGTIVSFAASNKAIFAAGPNVEQAKSFVISGAFGTDAVEMRVPTPNQAELLAVYASAVVDSGPMPDETISYKIECSTDGGASWTPLVDDWNIETIGYQVGDRMPWSLCYGDLDVSASGATEVNVRFSNNGSIPIERAEVYLVYRAGIGQPVSVTFAWNEQAANQVVTKRASHVFETAGPGDIRSWYLETANVMETNWIEMKLPGLSP